MGIGVGLFLRRTVVADSGYDDDVVVRERVVEHREVHEQGPPA